MLHRIFALALLITMTACNAPDGWKWEQNSFDGHPYSQFGEQSTAGRNVAYVLSRMDTEKGMKLELYGLSDTDEVNRKDTQITVQDYSPDTYPVEDMGSVQAQGSDIYDGGYVDDLPDTPRNSMSDEKTLVTDSTAPDTNHKDVSNDLDGNAQTATTSPSTTEMEPLTAEELGTVTPASGYENRVMHNADQGTMDSSDATMGDTDSQPQEHPISQNPMVEKFFNMLLKN